MRHLATLIGAVAIVALGIAAAAIATPPNGPPGQDPCSHGNTNKPCKPDPQPGHGQDCDHHGNYGGVNEDHCTPPPTDTTPTTPTDTTPITPTTITPTTPSGPRCPPGMTPTAGKDGQPGNQECEFPKQPPSSSTTTMPAPPTQTVTVTTTVPTPPTIITKTKIVTKTKVKRVPKIIYRNHTKIVRKTIVVHKTCPPNTRVWHGKCYPIVPGKG